VLIPFQDSILQATPLRFAGSSLSVVPLTILALIYFSEWLLRGVYDIDRRALIGSLYVVLVTLLNFVVFGIQSQGVNLIVKAINVGVLLILFLMPIFSVDYSDVDTVRWGVLCAFFVSVVAVLLGDFGLLPQLIQNPVFHNTPIDDLRPRGLAKESSMLSLQIVTLGLLAMHISTSKVGRMVIGVITALLIIYSGSKGGILTILITLLVLPLLRRALSWRQAFAFILIFVPLGFVAYQRMVEQIAGNFLSETTTAATRLSVAVCGVMTVLKHPFGVGLGGALPAMYENLPRALEWVRLRSPVPLNFSEVNEYLFSSTNSGTKIMFLEITIMFGVPAAIVCLYFLISLIIRANRENFVFLLIALVASSIAILTYVDGLILYNIPLLYGLTLYELRKRQNTSGRI